ncbi:hypothetical protein GGR56DRAFT_22858 [Xylariaceae sp. FL0804]|nr:hypothetical protein GGR56DRAFT_22858 [Xylariaceae sp. FL0804]
MHSLAGKRCVVTGGSRGIGLAIARHLADRGAACTLVGRSDAALRRAVAESLPPASPPGVAAQQHHRHHDRHDWRAFDVSRRSGWDELVAEYKDRGVDVLVNAAGVSQNSLLVRTRDEDLDELLDTNLRGTVLGCRAVLPLMMRQKSGCIINVSSLLASRGGQGASVYAATKAGVIALTRSLACEVGRFNVRTNVLLPGYIQTDMTQGMDKDKALSASIPMGRLGLADEVAHAAVFLAQNPYAHNCVLNIDGGLSAT